MVDWARREFFELADVTSSADKNSRDQRRSLIYPIALKAAQRLDALFDIERSINGKTLPGGSPIWLRSYRAAII